MANDDTNIEITFQNVNVIGNYDLENVSIAANKERSGNYETYTASDL